VKREARNSKQKQAHGTHEKRESSVYTFTRLFTDCCPENSHKGTKGKDRREEAKKIRRSEKSIGKKFLVSWWQSFHSLRATAGRHDELILKSFVFNLWNRRHLWSGHCIDSAFGGFFLFGILNLYVSLF